MFRNFTTKDVKEVYDEITPEAAEILVEGHHYHAGVYNPDNPNATHVEAMSHSVRIMYPHIDKNSKILDIGCGWGGTANMLSNELHASVTGVTISKNQAIFCKKKYPHLEIIESDFLTFETNKKYDIAIFNEVFFHIPFKHKLSVIKKARKMANRIIIKDGCFDYSGSFFKQLYLLFQDATLRCYNFMTDGGLILVDISSIQSIQKQLKKSGFKNIHVEKLETTYETTLRGFHRAAYEAFPELNNKHKHTLRHVNAILEIQKIADSKKGLPKYMPYFLIVAD